MKPYYGILIQIPQKNYCSMHRFVGQTLLNAVCRLLWDEYFQFDSIYDNTRKYDHIMIPALRAISWLPVREHLQYRYSLMTYKCMHELAPSSSNATRFTIWTRGIRRILNVPPYTTTAGQKSSHYRAVKIWNSIDNDLKKLPLKIFKTELKKKMLRNNWHYYCKD